MRKSKYCLDLLLNRHFLKIIIALLVLITLLQTFYVIRLTQPTPLLQIFHRQTRQHVLSKNSTILLKQCVQKLRKVHIMDSSGFYFIVPNIIKPVQGPPSDNHTGITVCVHCTPNHLHYLPDLARQWNGPISVTVFSDGLQAFSTVKSMIKLHLCNEIVRKFVSFHIVVPIQHARTSFNEVFDVSLNCDGVNADRFRSGVNYNIQDVPYPSNTLRNVAIQYTTTPYILTLDIDFVPSRDLNGQFQYFLQRQYRHSKTSNAISKTAFVLPSFESKYKEVKSMNKVDLKKQVEEGNIRPFYLEACKTCQEDTDYEKWLQFPSMDFLEMVYEVDWQRPWEPFYIAQKSQLPLFDSRFKQYGFNRISQLCEMYMAGFRFSVLNDAFLIHRGFKDSSSFHVNKTKEHQLNKQLFEQFKVDMKDRYPASKHQC